MNETTPEQIIVDIIANQMNLAKNAAWVRNENRDIPNDNGLYVVVGNVGTAPMNVETYIEQRTNSSYDPPQVENWEINKAQAFESIQIDILSSSDSARSRRMEILLALRSIYAQQKMEANSFKIFRLAPNFLNTSGAEGGSNINRFSITIVCTSWYKKERLMKEPGGDYYDDFTTRVDDANTIGTDDGLFEFRITPDTPEPEDS